MDLWLKRLQQSLSLEVQHGCIDLQGQHSTFSKFIQGSCADPPAELGELERSHLVEFANSFLNYSTSEVNSRRQLVIRLRQHLHEVRRRLDPPGAPAPPRLRLAEANPCPVPAAGDLNLETPLGQVAGLGVRMASRLASLGLWTVSDLLHYYPRDYVDYARLVRISDLKPGETATVVVTVRRCNAFASPRNPNLAILELQVQDSTGRLRLSKFMAGRRFTSPAWLHQQQRLYPPGATLAASGLVKENRFGLSFQDPLLEVLESPSAKLQSAQIGRLLPVYALTEGLVAEKLRAAIQLVLPAVEKLGEPLEARWRKQLQLPTRQEALQQIHQPGSSELLAAARHRLVFDEFLLLQLAMGQRRREYSQRQAPQLPKEAPEARLIAFRALLPFQFTQAQERVLQELRADLARAQAMARLVQGDVGSGKTVVAVAALLCVIDAGFQGALMAPTEVLAQQHYEKLAAWMPQLQVSVALLTGSTATSRRRELLQDLANGQLDLLVGTHALLEDPVGFAQLGLVVVDEQHRFGVAQRNRLLNKGIQPHLLTMTATPIPRTLALSVYGDLDVSQIDSLPPGRQPILTQIIDNGRRQEAEQLIRSEVEAGRQAYVVLPLVEESDKLELRSATKEHLRLADEVFPELRLGLLHGRLSSADKQMAIEAFARGETQVLVCTTVVEVGVDVPNATVMLIDHAERFGLAQLHQLRGRVGRGLAASHCLLIHSGSSAIAKQRLEVLARTTDGFEIAEMDLRLRGPGQVLGTRQSGLPDLALASLSDDGAVLDEARQVAQAILEADPQLRKQPLLAEALASQRRHLAAAVRLN